MIDVITITSSLPDEDGSYKEFHFNREDKKDRFIRTLYAHRLSDIGFSEESIEMNVTKELLIELDKDPIEYAKECVFWGKNVVNRYFADHLTKEELAYIRSLA